MDNATINRLVAEKVMGWPEIADAPIDPVELYYSEGKPFPAFRVFGARVELVDSPDDYEGRAWNPAENVADAIEALEKWASADGRRHWHCDNWGMSIDERYEAALHDGHSDGTQVHKGRAAVLPLAICKALLAAHGIEA